MHCRGKGRRHCIVSNLEKIDRLDAFLKSGQTLMLENRTLVQPNKFILVSCKFAGIHRKQQTAIH